MGRWRPPTPKASAYITPAGNAVRIGAIVEVCDERGDLSEYRIVGPDEADAARSAISMDSPVARALLGKRVDDVTRVTVGGEDSSLTVVSIRYAAAG